MKKLLNIEYLKIINYKTGRFFIIAYFAILIFAAVGLSQNVSFLGMELNLEKFGIFDFPHVWHFTTYFAAIAKIFLAIIVITTVTNEFSFGTMKQNLIDGLSKKEFVMSKTLTAVILALASTFMVFLIAMTLGLLSTDGVYTFWSEFIYIPAYFLKLITFFAFCIFLSVLVRKSAFTFALFFVWWIIESILNGIELVIRAKIFDESIESMSGNMITQYLPLTSMSELIPAPFKRIEALDMATQGQMNVVEINIVFVVACIIYFALFTYLSYALIKKRDL